MTIRQLLVLPADPEQMVIGGIATFIRGYVAYAPRDFEFGMVGFSKSRAVGAWHSMSLEGKSLRFLAIANADTNRRSRIPLALRFALAGIRQQRLLDLDDWIPSIHRPGSEFLLSRHPGPMWRVVHLTSNDLASAGSESRWRHFAAVLDRIEYRAFQRMDRVYVVNRRAVERYRHAYPEIADRFRFLPNWVDDRIFREEAGDVRSRRRAELCQRLGLPAGSDVVLYAGRLEGQKDPLLLAASFAALRQRRPRSILLIAGDGGLRDATVRRLRDLGVRDAARFLGVITRSELAATMTASDLFILTSRFETGPTVALEALASALPVVTTDVGEVSEILRPGRGGRVVATRGPEDVAAAADALLAGNRPEIRAGAVLAASPFFATRVLSELYTYQRELVERYPKLGSALAQ